MKTTMIRPSLPPGSSAFVIPNVPELAGLRLDRALAQSNPGLSLRASRRLIEDGRLLVNGRESRPGHRLTASDCLHFRTSSESRAPFAKVISVKNDFVFFYKPAGLHTVALKGRCNDSLEKQLPELLHTHSLPQTARLLQRLDWGTNGIVSAALSKEAGEIYREMERAGKICKYYLAVLNGHLMKDTIAKCPLDGQRVPKVKTLPGTADPERWTCFKPLKQVEDVTIAMCRIKKGQRHQIRAHAQSIGLPLQGDELYGGGKGGFSLTHYRLQTTVFDISYLPVLSKLGLPLDELPSSLLSGCM